MKICGCSLSIRYSAVVPHFWWPTMKKSGTDPLALAGSSAAAEPVLAPSGKPAPPGEDGFVGAVIAPESNGV